jgi:ABC-type phosphate/phosphonate transport system substrate-binding protein
MTADGPTQPLAWLPMYALPEMAAANAALWAALAEALAESGLTETPLALTPAPLALPPRLVSETFFSQMCGYPLLTLYGGQYSLLGAPLYDFPGCDSGTNGTPTHGSVLVVGEAAAFRDPADLRGTHFAINGWDSNSGMNLPRRLFAPLAVNGRFFETIVVTGSHLASLEAVASGQADAAAIDCVTFGFAARYRPTLIGRLRILAETAKVPAIPFITSSETPAAVVAILRAALLDWASRPKLAQAMAGLHIRDIRPVSVEDYAAVTALEEEAAAMGYPSLA